MSPRARAGAAPARSRTAASRPAAAEARDDTPGAAAVARVRRFNRFYTRLVGALDEGHLASDFSLTAVRLLYELAHWPSTRPGDGALGPPARRATAEDAPTATEVGRALGLDPGYLSRMLRTLEERGLVARTADRADGRQSYLRLTPAGRATFAELDARAGADVAALLARLGPGEPARLLAAMDAIEALLGDRRPRQHAPNVAPPDDVRPPFVLRTPAPGDLGWVVARHGVLYAAEYGWDARFEALVARVVADFGAAHDPARERCWIAERTRDADERAAPERVGSVFLVRHPERDGVAKLRLLLVEPTARGLGLGARLVDECTRFARAAGYHTITLWTNSVLTSARRLYEAAGYRLVSEEPHATFGPRLVGQTWELAL